MNNLGMRVTLTLGLLAVAGGPAAAERYVVEPIAAPVAAAPADEQGFSQGELDQMLAPIALYPDSLLSQVLIASTYPLEIVEAARWSRQNTHLQGEDAVAAVANREWDPSVKSLIAFPELLSQMDEDLEWTRRLGDAMLFQEEQVMDSIQFLRARADAAGHLETTEYARVIREEKTIIIEPVHTRVVHVPYYDPYVVYGPWWRPAYPPVYWAAPSYYSYGYPGFYWSSGIHVSSGFFFSSFYWPQRSVVIVNTPRYHHARRYHASRPYYAPGQRWTHNPTHRRGVAYRHGDVRQRYDQPRLRAGPATRWPLEDRSARTDRASRDGERSRDGRRDGRIRESNRADQSGSNWRDRLADSTRTTPREQSRDRSVGTSRPDSSARRPAREAGEARLSAGTRTTRPNVTGTQQRLRSTRENPGTNVRSQQHAVAPTPRAAGSSQRSASVSQRATAPSQRSASVSQRATTPAPQTRASGRSAPTAARAAAPQARATNRASGRGNESRAATGGQREARGTSNRRGAPGRDGRRFD